MSEPTTSPQSGLDMAAVRGSELLRSMTESGELLAADDFASLRGLSLGALEGLEARGEIFSIGHDGGRWYACELLQLRFDGMCLICRVVAPLTSGEQFLFFTRGHGVLGGQTISQSISSSGIDRALRLAQLWVRERTPSR